MAGDSHRDKEQLLLDVNAKAAIDPVFRQALLADPHAAIFAGFGMRVPDRFRLRFIEKGSDVDALIVLPDAVRPGGELGDDDLEAVAGGSNNPAGSW